jgi:hypothetical protein
MAEGKRLGGIEKETERVSFVVRSSATDLFKTTAQLLSLTQYHSCRRTKSQKETSRKEKVIWIDGRDWNFQQTVPNFVAVYTILNV